MTANALPGRLRTSRWLYGWTILLLLYMLLALPFPPTGREVAAYARLLAAILACAAAVLGVTRGWLIVKPVAALLGLVAVYQVGVVAWVVSRSGPGPRGPVLLLLLVTCLGLAVAALCTLTVRRADTLPQQ